MDLDVVLSNPSADRPAMRPRPLALTLFALVWLAGALVPHAAACPFCAAESRTLTEEINDSTAVVLARLAEPSPASADPADAGVPYEFVDPETGAAEFEVLDILLGQEALGDAKRIEASYFG